MFEKEYAQLQRQQSLQQQGEDPLMQGFPSQVLGAEQAQAPQPSFLSMLSPMQTPSAKENLNAQLIKIGLSPQQISLNSAGKQQLTSKLEQLYGADYAKDPEAQAALQAFDSYMQTDTGKLADVKLKNNTKTILGALRNYGQET